MCQTQTQLHTLPWQSCHFNPPFLFLQKTDDVSVHASPCHCSSHGGVRSRLCRIPLSLTITPPRRFPGHLTIGGGLFALLFNPPSTYLLNDLPYPVNDLMFPLIHATTPHDHPFPVIYTRSLTLFPYRILMHLPSFFIASSVLHTSYFSPWVLGLASTLTFHHHPPLVCLTRRLCSIYISVRLLSSSCPPPHPGLAFAALGRG